MNSPLCAFLIDQNVLTQDELAELKRLFSECDRLAETQAKYGHDQVRRLIKDAAKRAAVDYSAESFEHYEKALSGQTESRERIAVLRSTAKVAIKTFVEKEWSPFVSTIAARVLNICNVRILACSEPERQLASRLRVDHTPSSGIAALEQAAQEILGALRSFQVATLGESRAVLKWLSERPKTAGSPPISSYRTTTPPPAPVAEIQGPSLQETPA